MALTLKADAQTPAARKALATAACAKVQVAVSPSTEKTACGLPVLELHLGPSSVVRQTNAVLRALAKMYEDSDLMGSNFFESGQVDSWLDWTSMEVDHLLLETEDISSLLQVLEEHLKSRTFLVGQRLTVADISLACSLSAPFQKAGHEKLRESHPNSLRWLLTSLHHIDRAMSTTPTPAPSPAAIPSSAQAKPAKPAQATSEAGEGKAPKAAKAEAGEAVGEGGGSKKDEKKKAKEAEKKAKEEERKRKEEEALAAKNAKFAGPALSFENFQEHSFGNLFIQSQGQTGRTWTNIGALKPEMKDSQVWIRARVHNTRKQGNKLCFLTLRQDVATVQAVTFGQDIAGFSGSLPDESVVDVYGKVSCPDAPIVSCTVQNVELSVEKIFCIGRSQALPLRLADASRSEAELEKDPSLPTVGQDVRLDNRIIDLRTVANQAIFRLQSGVCELFREFLLQNKFQEIHTPKLIGGASEGGADVFRVDYFEGSAFLAQSPQLYKQMALMTDMPRVFEVGPIFRSEKSFTHRHMTEFTGLDIEMTFKDHYHEVLEVLDGLFNHIFKGLTERFGREIEAVKSQYPFEDLKWKHPCLRLKFSEAIALLRREGPPILEQRIKDAASDYDRKILEKHLASVKAHEENEDISTEDEKLLGIIIHKTHGEDFYIIDKFPKEVRPFYTMPDPIDEKWTNAYDLFLRGEEITSGAQRIHDPQMLTEKAKAWGVPPASIQSYIDAFKYGSYPHAGAGIGMERVVMLFLNLNNIRKTSMFPRDPKRLTP